MNLVRLIQVLAVLAWWLGDLQVHWRTLAEFQHGWMVPALAGYLVWERAPRLPPATPPESLVGPLLLAVASTPFVVLAELYKTAIANTPTASFCLSVGCLGFVVALLWLGGGKGYARDLVFPIAFLFVAVPLPAILWNPLVLSLQSFIALLNVEALNLIGIPATRSGNTLQLPTGLVGVDEACSGVRSLQSSVMAALFVSDLILRRPGAKAFFLAAGVLLAVAGNFCRSLYLAYTAAHDGVSAVARVHDTAGWSVFGFTAVGITLLAWWLVRAESRAAASPHEGPGRLGGSRSRASE